MIETEYLACRDEGGTLLYVASVDEVTDSIVFTENRSQAYRYTAGWKRFFNARGIVLERLA